MTFKELKKWYKNTGRGFFTIGELQNTHPDVLKAFERELEHSTGRVGCYVYHSHILENGKLVFKGMKVGYYVRSKNPFSWKFKKTYGNR